MTSDYSHLILDACCILNFSASGYLADILESLDLTVAVSQLVYEQELQCLQKLQEDCERSIQFHESINNGSISLVNFHNSDEENDFIDLLFELKDDGESATAAIAIRREWQMATDDRRATSYLNREFPSLEIITTLDIVKHWFDADGIQDATLQEALQNIRRKGKYMPHNSHHLKSWWDSYMT